MKKISSLLLALIIMAGMLSVPVYAETAVLADPAGLVWDGSVARWDDVENASDYKVQLYADKIAAGEPVISSVNEFDFTQAADKTAAYSFSVTAVGDGENFTDSGAVMSDELDYVKDGDIKFQFNKKNDYVSAPSVKDAALRSSVGRYYWTEGQGWILWAGKNGTEQFRSIIRVDVSALKGKVNVLDAELKLQVRNAPAKDLILDIYSISDGDGDWVANTSGDRAVNAVSPGQKKRHGNNAAEVYLKNADGSGEAVKINTNHKDFEQYLKNKENWKMYKDAACTTEIAWSDNDGVDWAGGFMLGDPGAGSYDETPFDSVTVAGGSSSPVEITVPREILKEWIDGNNNGILVRAREDNAGTGVSFYAADVHNTYQPSSATTFPALIVHTTDKAEDGVYLSYEVTDNGGISEISADVYNCGANDIKPALIAAVYDADGTMKNVYFDDSKTISKMTGTENYVLSYEAAEGDSVKVMLFNSLNGLNPYTDVRIVGKETVVSTNASDDFNPETNVTEPGRWSYYDCYGSDDEVLKMTRLLTSDGTENNSGATWYVDYKGKPGTWKINRDKIISSSDRNMGIVYTIGEEMAGKTITIEGTYTAGTNASRLFICRSADVNPNTVDTYPIVLDKIQGLNTTGRAFKVVITPDKAVYGNDIILSTKNTCDIGSITISAK